MSFHSSLCSFLLLASIATSIAHAAPILSQEKEELQAQSLRGIITTSRKLELEKKPRIIGGVPAEPNRHPYFALMNGSASCGAVLISKRFILTAAHCAGVDDDFEIGISEKLSGWASWFSDSDSGGVEYPHKSVVIHPDYKTNGVDSDIAIYELESDVPDSIPYMRLEKDAVTVAGTSLSVIGFGDTNPDSTDTDASNFLLEATVEYLPNDDCINQMKSAWGFLYTIEPSMICAYSEEQDSCQGDSGGPLFLKGETVADDSLVGVVSWGYGCGASTPGVYARISHFYDWIVETMCAVNEAGVPDYIDCSNIVGNGGGSSGVSIPTANDPMTRPSTGIFADEDNLFANHLWETVEGWIATLSGR